MEFQGSSSGNFDQLKAYFGSIVDWPQTSLNGELVAFTQRPQSAVWASETMMKLDISPSEYETEAIVFLCRCCWAERSFAAVVDCETALTARQKVLSFADKALIERVIIEELQTSLEDLRGLKIGSGVDRAGRRREQKMKILGKLVGKDMSDSHDKLIDFVKSHQTDLALVQALVLVSDSLERNWRYILPMLLAFLDCNDFFIRREACLVLLELCARLSEVDEDKEDNILIKSQTEPFLRERIVPLMLSLPSLTPDAESVALVDVSYDALLQMVEVAYTDLDLNLHLASILNDYIIPSMTKVQDHPQVLDVLVDKLCRVVVASADFATVICKQIIFALLSILMDPYLVPVHKSVVKLLRALQLCLSVYQNCNMDEYRYNVLGCMGVLRRRCDDSEEVLREVEKVEEIL